MNTTFIINNEFMGHGDTELGYKLTGAFLKKLWARKEKPTSILFYNSGVKLLASGSHYIDVLTGLDESGVDLIACGTCVEKYQLEDSFKVGRISGMEELVNIMMTSDNVVTI